MNFFHSMLDFAIGAYYDNRLVALAGVINFQMMIGGKAVPCAGISAVASDPAHRRRGLIRGCVKEALLRMHEKRVPLTALWPFSYPFYEKMGYRVTDFHYSIELNCSTIADLGSSRRYEKLDFNDYRPFKPLYDEWIAGHNMGIRRGDLQWSRLASHPHRENHAFIHDQGYMLWNLKDPQDRTLEIVEWACLSDDAFLDGLSLLKRMDDLRFDKVRFTCPTPERFLRLGIGEPVPKVVMKPGLMARVLHVESFAEHLANGVNFPQFVVDDPLSVSSGWDSFGEPQQEHSGAMPLSPGDVIQAITGLWKEFPIQLPEGLSGLYADRPNFTAEFF